MQQDTFFYSNFSQDPRLQYPNANPYPVQPNAAPWSGNYIPESNLSQAQGMPNPFNYGNQLQPNEPPLSGTTPTISWAHSVPSLMPWVTQSEMSVPDPVVRFTAPFPPDPCTSQTATSWELLNNFGAHQTNANMHLKRKSDIDVIESEMPHKMCITEERMSARLKELHISNKYSVPADTSPFGPYGDSSCGDIPQKSATTLKQLEAMLNESSEGNVLAKSLVLAPELKKLVEPEKIFARTFLDKVERPSMAVVVWQPQNTLLTNANNNLGDSKTEEEKESSDSHHLMTKGNNNNFLSQLQLSAICNQNASFAEANSATSSSAISEDIMDT